MGNNIIFSLQCSRICKVFAKLADMEAAEIKRNFPELWEALLHAETLIKQDA